MTERPLSESERKIIESLSPAHRDPVRRLFSIQQDILDALQADRRSTPTAMIHHYSDEGGLRGITGNGTLRLSEYTSMSDSSEIKYGCDIGIEELQKAYQAGARTDRQRRFVEGTVSKAKQGFGTVFNAYILSLTPNGDELTQWDRYAAKTSGYCLGFDATILDAAFVSFTQQKKLEASGSFEVLYEEARLRDLMRQYADNALAAVDRLVEPLALRKQTVEAMQHIGVNLMFAIIFTALFFKHPSYYSEKEYRYLMMTLPDKTIPGRVTRPARGGGMVGFFELDWKSQHGHALTMIRIGPGKQEAEGRRIVAEALSSTGLSPEIVMSVIPPIRN